MVLGWGDNTIECSLLRRTNVLFYFIYHFPRLLVGTRRRFCKKSFLLKPCRTLGFAFLSGIWLRKVPFAFMVTRRTGMGTTGVGRGCALRKNTKTGTRVSIRTASIVLIRYMLAQAGNRHRNSTFNYYSPVNCVGVPSCLSTCHLGIGFESHDTSQAVLPQISR